MIFIKALRINPSIETDFITNTTLVSSIKGNTGMTSTYPIVILMIGDRFTISWYASVIFGIMEKIQTAVINAAVGKNIGRNFLNLMISGSREDSAPISPPCKLGIANSPTDELRWL